MGSCDAGKQARPFSVITPSILGEPEDSDDRLVHPLRLARLPLGPRRLVPGEPQI